MNHKIKAIYHWTCALNRASLCLHSKAAHLEKDVSSCIVSAPSAKEETANLMKVGTLTFSWGFWG